MKCEKCGHESDSVLTILSPREDAIMHKALMKSVKVVESDSVHVEREQPNSINGYGIRFWHRYAGALEEQSSALSIEIAQAQAKESKR